MRHVVWSLVALLVCLLGSASAANAQETRAFGRTWGSAYSETDWERFYHYPYVYYPQNYYGQEYYRSSESLYYRYPQEMRIPVYNRQWHNELPQPRRYHQGHQFTLDIF
jgi:hypothetical protein